MSFGDRVFVVQHIINLVGVEDLKYDQEFAHRLTVRIQNVQPLGRD